MASVPSDVLREFLVRIAYREDEASRQRFSDNLLNVTKTVLGLVAAVEGAVATVAVATVKMGSSFERLYWLSQRTFSTPDNIKRWSYQISQVGGSVEGAQQALASFTNWLATNPGASQLLSGTFGIKVQGRQGTDILQDVLARLREMPYFQAAYFADRMGIPSDPEQLMSLLRDSSQYGREFDEVARKSKVDYEEAQKKAVEFMRQVRLLGLEIDVIKTKLFSRLFDKFGDDLERLTRYLLDHGDEIVDNIERIIDKMIELADQVDRIAASMGGWENVLAGFLIFFTTTWVLGMLAGIAQIATALGPVAATLRWMTGLGLAAGGGALAGNAAYNAMDTEMQDKWGEWAAKLAAGPGGRWSQNAAEALRLRRDLHNAELTGRAREAVDFFTKQGWSAEQASGLVGNFIRESNLQSGAVGDGGKARGIGQWHPDRQAEFKRVFGKDISQATFLEQLQFAQYELTRGAERAAGGLLSQQTTTGDAGAVASKYYFRPADTEGEMYKRAALSAEVFDRVVLGSKGGPGGGVNINAPTQITVQASSDPGATARAVGGEQSRVYADVVRNLSSPVR